MTHLDQLIHVAERVTAERTDLHPRRARRRRHPHPRGAGAAGRRRGDADPAAAAAHRRAGRPRPGAGARRRRPRRPRLGGCEVPGAGAAPPHHQHPAGPAHPAPRPRRRPDPQHGGRRQGSRSSCRIARTPRTPAATSSAPSWPPTRPGGRSTRSARSRTAPTTRWLARSGRHRAGWAGAHRELADHRGRRDRPARRRPGARDGREGGGVPHRARGARPGRRRRRGSRHERRPAPRPLPGAQAGGDLGAPPRRRRPRRCTPARRTRPHRRRRLGRPRRQPRPWTTRRSRCSATPPNRRPTTPTSRAGTARGPRGGRPGPGAAGTPRPRSRATTPTVPAPSCAPAASTPTRPTTGSPPTSGSKPTAPSRADADRHREITEDYELDRPPRRRPCRRDRNTETGRRAPGRDRCRRHPRDQRHRTPTNAPNPAVVTATRRLDETAEDVARAQLALQEIEHRRQYEQAGRDRARRRAHTLGRRRPCRGQPMRTTTPTPRPMCDVLER